MVFSRPWRRLGRRAGRARGPRGIAACGSSDDSSSSSSGGGGAKIALLLPESKTTRYEKQDKPLFEKKVKELCSDCEVLYSNAEQDPAKQQQQAEAAITDGAKVLVLDAVDVKSAAAIAQRAKQQGVKVVSYGRLVADAPLDYDVSIDPFDVGVQQGEALMSALKKKGVSNPRIIMINGAPTDSNAKPYKLLTGDQLMTVYQPIPKIAATAAELAVPLAQGKTPPSDLTPEKVDNGAGKVPSALLKTLVITKDNIKGTVVADGFLTTKQICTGAYKKACQANGLE
jgi:ABC-type xylose transport system substrate-binding protein